MRIALKITEALLARIREDLARPHPFALERVGFITCRFVWLSPDGILVLAHTYLPVEDSEYIEDSRFGALIGAQAFRKAMQVAYTNDVGIFHVHLHDHPGSPSPSRIDLRETQKFVPDFFHVRPLLPHGAVILSADSMSGRVWLPARNRPTSVGHWAIVGSPMTMENLQ